MSKRLFEFVCKSGHKSEAFVDSNTQEIYCRTCDEPAQRIISPVRSKLDWVSGDFPTATATWAREREQATRIARKREADHGEDA